MNNPGERAYRFLRNDTNRLLLSVAIAYVFSACSLVSFSLTSGGDATRIQFALLAVAAGLLFYSLVRAEEGP
jgi:hypothetical protein